MKILIVEDEIELQSSIQKYLTIQGYLVETASNFEQGLYKLSSHSYQCILLDIGLPDANGLELLKTLKETKSNAGIIILSAKNSLEDRVKGLELGADDYVSKPFHLSELNARIFALLRRKNSDGDQYLEFKEIKLSQKQKRVFVHDHPIDLTEKEFTLLEYFIINKGLVLTKLAIAEHGWGDEFDQVDNYDFIYTHIKNLRKKLIQAGSEDYIRTIYGMGYRFTSQYP